MLNASPLYPSKPFVFKSAIIALFIALIPKCPACWFMYLCFWGGCGLGAFCAQPVLLSLLSGLLLINTIIFFRRACQSHCRVPFVLSSLGAITVLLGVVLLQQPKVPMLTPCVLNQPGIQCLSFDLPPDNNLVAYPADKKSADQ